MIFLTEQLLNDNKKLLNLIDDEITLNQAALKSQKALKILLLDYMQKLATSTIVEPSNSSQILKVLLSFKSSLELSKTNIINLENLVSLFNDIKSQDPSAILSNIDVFNSTIIDINEELFKNNSEILQTLKLTLDNSIKISTTNTKNSTNTDVKASETDSISDTINSEISTSEETKTENTINSENGKNEDTTSNNASENSTENVAETSEETNVNNKNSQEGLSTDAQATSTPSQEELKIQEIIQDASKEVQEELENSTETNTTITNTEDTKLEENKNESTSSTKAQDEQTTDVEEKVNHNIATSYHQTIEKEQEKVENINQQIQEVFEEPITIRENTLIISEKTKKVFLPYDCDSLETVFKNNPNEYSSVEDIIRKDFIVPLASYKIPSISRFRESYKLMRIKENKSFKESLDLAFELFFNYNLHPAIISACRNLDELDIYLDYLAENETHKFSCFDIVFEVTPTTTSKHSLIPKRN